VLRRTQNFPGGCGGDVTPLTQGFVPPLFLTARRPAYPQAVH